MNARNVVLFAIGIGSFAATAAQAQDPGAVATERCWRAAENEARGMMGAGNPKRTREPYIFQESNAETRVSGSGELNGREFSWSCTYNIRSGATYSVSVQPSGGFQPPRPGYDQGYRPGYQPPYQPGYQPGNEWGRGVPLWAVGKWQGYNQKNRTNVRLNIERNGQVKYNAGGQRGNADIRNGILHQGLARYRIEQTRNGFVTIQVGDERNVTYYTRR